MGVQEKNGSQSQILARTNTPKRQKKNIHAVCRPLENTKHSTVIGFRPLEHAHVSVVPAAVSPSTETRGEHCAEWSADNLYSKTMPCTSKPRNGVCVLLCSRRPRRARRPRARRTSVSPIKAHKTLRNAQIDAGCIAALLDLGRSSGRIERALKTKVRANPVHP